MHQAPARAQFGLPPRRGKRVAKKGGRPDPISDLQKLPGEGGHGLERPGGPMVGGRFPAPDFAEEIRKLPY